MYDKLYDYYNNRINANGTLLSNTKKKVYSLGSLRLFVFLATVFLVYFLREQNSAFIVLTIALGVILFLFLLLKYNKFQKKKQYLEISIQCDTNELKALDYDFSAFDGAKEKINANHSFSLDLDLFGKKSLFQSINRTCTNYGKKVLVKWFEKPLTDSNKIESRQKAIQELKEKPQFIHHFQVTGLINTGKPNDYSELEEFANSSPLIGKRNWWKLLTCIIPAIWIVGITSVALSLIPGTALVWLYIITLAISESRKNKVDQLQNIVGKKVEILKAYSALIKSVENESFQAELLQNLQANFLEKKEKEKKASIAIQKLSRLVNELEQRANVAVRLVLNPLLLRDIQKSIQIETWKEEHGNQFLVWIKALGKLDAFCSLGIFAFNHPDYSFPTFTDSYFKMVGKALGHPLMNRNTCVKNDIELPNKPFFLIITGANMAGKSTYLRTIGVNFTLACIGTPVCADSLTVYPANLVTSLRTSDSLNDNESYFFAELKRLKMIIDRIQNGEKLFIILDEILKGTNSVDKQKGSLALVQQFIRLQSCGIIATHDLLLGELEKEFPGKIKNYRFEADITNEELTFSYQLREGIAQNMNASFLMKKMGITV